MNNNLIPAVAYIRVSTDEQVQGFSLDAQKERIIAYAKSQDYFLVNVYSDDGYSAKDLNRPTIKNLLSDIKYGKLKIILAYKLERLANKLKKKITEIHNKRKKIIDWLAKTLPAKTTTGDINTELEKMDKKSQKLKENLLLAEARIRNLQQGNYTTEIICGYLKKFDYLYEGFNPGQRKLLVESLVKKVNVDSKEKIDLKLSLPLAPLTSYIKKVQGGIRGG